MAPNKVALVTGANRGLGLEIVRRLIDKGFYVYLSARDPRKGRRALKSLGRPDSAAFLRIDVGDPAGVRAAARVFGKSADRLDVLVNNASVLPDGDKGLFEAPLAGFGAAFRVNALGPLLTAREFAPYLLKSGSARIVNVSSVAGSLTLMRGWAPAYCVSKAALNAVTRQLAVAFRGKGVLVNAVDPGWMRTDMGGANASRSVQEGAETAVWLAAEAPENVNGQFLRDRKPVPW